MHKYIRLAFIFLLGFCATLKSQSTILDQSLLTDASFSTFTTVSVAGAQSWYHSSIYGAVCSGYATGQSFDNQDWLISPVIDLAQTDNVKLTFSHTRGNAAVMNAGLAEGWYKVFATPDYTGDPATTQWIELTGVNQALPAAWQFISSGDLIIPDAAKSATSRVAFRYISTAAQSATWEIENVKVTGEPQGTSPNAGVFKITNWNVEWLGCTNFGPTDETLQINNVVSAMLSMNSDIYCLQEITNTTATIPMLVSLMGSDEWGGAIVPATGDDCNQKQGIIFKKSRVELSGALMLSSGDYAEGNSYYYNWSSGRYPAVFNVNLVSGTNSVPLTIVNIHAKAEDGNAMSYTRRLGGSEALKTILDAPAYNTKNLMLIGDYNDFLVGTSSDACACSLSPFDNFMSDAAHYTGITQNITDAIWSRPVIENLIISDELTGNYVANSAAQEVSVTQGISNYHGTTSDHFPLSTTFQFPLLGTPHFSAPQNALAIYPNPVKNELMFNADMDPEAAVIYDVMGRRMRCEKISENTFDVSALPSGVYILKAGERYGRFVKE